MEDLKAVAGPSQHVYTYGCVHLCMYVYVHTYMYVYIHMYVLFVYVYIYIYILIVCIHIYMLHTKICFALRCKSPTWIREHLKKYASLLHAIWRSSFVAGGHGTSSTFGTPWATSCYADFPRKVTCPAACSGHVLGPGRLHPKLYLNSGAVEKAIACHHRQRKLACSFEKGCA